MRFVPSIKWNALVVLFFVQVCHAQTIGSFTNLTSAAVANLVSNDLFVLERVSPNTNYNVSWGQMSNTLYSYWFTLSASVNQAFVWNGTAWGPANIILWTNLDTSVFQTNASGFITISNIPGVFVKFGSLLNALLGTDASGNVVNLTNVNADVISAPYVQATLQFGFPSAFFLSTTLGRLMVNTNLDAVGTVSATNGVASFKNNKLGPSSISVTASPFNYTNVQPVNIQIFLDANGATTTLAFNGTTVFTSLINGDHSTVLQPGDWITVTYSVATPVMKYREF